MTKQPSTHFTGGGGLTRPAGDTHATGAPAPATLVEVVPVVDKGLGNASYLVNLGDGRAAVIDPQRDLRPYLSWARREHVSLSFAVETHIHADFVTGSRELAHAGAQIIAAASAGLAFEHSGVEDGQHVDLGGLSLELLATPGHTPDHASWPVHEGNTPVGVFTGGALVVGGVARTDLAGAKDTQRWARAAYRSVRDRLLTLPDTLPVWPTHGPGSFCSTGGSDERTSTIGRERSSNPLLVGNPDEEESCTGWWAAWVPTRRISAGSRPTTGPDPSSTAGTGPPCPR